MKPIMNNFEGLMQDAARVRNLQAHLLSKRYSNLSFSPNELNVLIFLSNNPSINTAKELVYYLRVSKALVCRSVDSLMEKGYLDVQEDEQDRRIQRLNIHEKAIPIIHELRLIRDEITLKLSKDIPKADLETMERVFARIRENARDLEDYII